MGYFGTSHYAVEDIAVARTMTNTTVIAPADAASTRQPDALHRRPGRPGLHPDRRGAPSKVYDQAPEYAAAVAAAAPAAAT